MPPLRAQAGPLPAGSEFVRGLTVSLGIAIPLWAGIGIVAIALLQDGPVRAYQTTALIMAAVAETVVLHYVWRMFRPRLAPRRPRAVARPIFRPTLLLSTLAGSYLHYYFWDVQLQIASLSSVTVFVPQSALG